MFGDAKCDYEKGLSYSDNEAARIYLIQCVEKIRYYENDTGKYAERIQGNPELPENYFGRALCYYYQGKYEEAGNDFRHLVGKYPEDDFYKKYFQDCMKKSRNDKTDIAALR